MNLVKAFLLCIYFILSCVMFLFFDLPNFYCMDHQYTHFARNSLVLQYYQNNHVSLFRKSSFPVSSLVHLSILQFAVKGMFKSHSYGTGACEIGLLLNCFSIAKILRFNIRVGPRSWSWRAFVQ